MGAGCTTTYGKLHVGQPQIFTRERLVEERFRESDWLRKQLSKADEIKTSHHGIRDLREFVGVYNELKAEFDPAQGLLNRLDLKSQTLEKSDEKSDESFRQYFQSGFALRSGLADSFIARKDSPW